MNQSPAPIVRPHVPMWRGVLRVVLTGVIALLFMTAASIPVTILLGRDVTYFANLPLVILGAWLGWKATRGLGVSGA